MTTYKKVIWWQCFKIWENRFASWKLWAIQSIFWKDNDIHFLDQKKSD